MAVSVETLRKYLSEEGLSESEIKNIKGKVNLKLKLEEVSKGRYTLDNMDDLESTEKEEEPFQVEVEEGEPSGEIELTEEISPTSLEWKAFILAKFDPSDEIFNGSPTVDGLRRVVEDVFGPIIDSRAHVVQSPNKDNDFHAVVEHETTILRLYYLPDGKGPFEQTVREVADVRTEENNIFTRYAAGYASTRAEGRSLRKLLRLRKMVAAEEIDTNMGYDEQFTDGPITNSQITALNILGQRCDIKLWEFIKSGSPTTLRKPKDIPRSLAIEIIGYLNKVMQKKETVSDEFVGFEKLNLD